MSNDIEKLYKMRNDKSSYPSKMAYTADITERETGIELPDDVWTVIGNFVEPNSIRKYNREEREFQLWYRNQLNELINMYKSVLLKKHKVRELKKTIDIDIEKKYCEYQIKRLENEISEKLEKMKKKANEFFNY